VRRTDPAAAGPDTDRGWLDGVVDRRERGLVDAPGDREDAVGVAASHGREHHVHLAAVPTTTEDADDEPTRPDRGHVGEDDPGGREPQAGLGAGDQRGEQPAFLHHEHGAEHVEADVADAQQRDGDGGPDGGPQPSDLARDADRELDRRGDRERGGGEEGGEQVHRWCSSGGREGPTCPDIRERGPWPWEPPPQMLAAASGR
jgi:hypothetical protein